MVLYTHIKWLKQIWMNFALFCCRRSSIYILLYFRKLHLYTWRIWFCQLSEFCGTIRPSDGSLDVGSVYGLTQIISGCRSTSRWILILCGRQWWYHVPSYRRKVQSQEKRLGANCVNALTEVVHSLLRILIAPVQYYKKLLFSISCIWLNYIWNLADPPTRL